MSAAVSLARTPLSQDALGFWEDLIEECKRQTEAINSVASASEPATDNVVQWEDGPAVHMFRSRRPSTDVRIELSLRSWGPAIRGSITGRQTDDLKFAAEEFEFAIARDLDGRAVVIFEEGRSFSPTDMAAYITQKFQRCFPTLSLPCRTWERDSGLRRV